jgi:5-methylcytosine-specific restriction protein A
MTMRICGKINCNKLVEKEARYCDEHKKEYDKKVKNSQNWYRQNRDDKDEQDFYKSKKWIKSRTNTLERDFYLCRLCYIEKLVTTADMVHHIVELKEDKSLALDAENLISLCDGCHKKVHGKYNTGYKIETQKMLRNIIISPPTSRNKDIPNVSGEHSFT